MAESGVRDTRRTQRSTSGQESTKKIGRNGQSTLCDSASVSHSGGWPMPRLNVLSAIQVDKNCAQVFVNSQWSTSEISFEQAEVCC